MKNKLYIIGIMVSFLLTNCAEEKEKEQVEAKEVKPLKSRKERKLSFNTDWIGEWQRPEKFYVGNLKISQQADSIVFDLVAQNGANTGELQGMILAEDNKAVYINDENGKCKITFELLGDSVIVLNEEESDCGAGYGVNFSGRYSNANRIMNQPDMQETLQSKGIFQSAKEESVFKRLVGNSKYMLFINSSQEVIEGEDLDSTNARVYESGVKGMYTFMENIVMVNDSSKIWAAVIDDNKVRYFTNDGETKKKLPQTIEKWRERFKDYEIVYEK